MCTLWIFLPLLIPIFRELAVLLQLGCTHGEGGSMPTATDQLLSSYQGRRDRPSTPSEHVFDGESECLVLLRDICSRNFRRQNHQARLYLTASTAINTLI